MIEKLPKEQSVDIWPIPFQNDDPINSHLENKGKILVSLKPKFLLHSVVYPISESNS